MHPETGLWDFSKKVAGGFSGVKNTYFVFKIKINISTYPTSPIFLTPKVTEKVGLRPTLDKPSLTGLKSDHQS